MLRVSEHLVPCQTIIFEVLKQQYKKKSMQSKPGLEFGDRHGLTLHGDRGMVSGSRFKVRVPRADARGD